MVKVLSKTSCIHLQHRKQGFYQNFPEEQFNQCPSYFSGQKMVFLHCHIRKKERNKHKSDCTLLPLDIFPDHFTTFHFSISSAAYLYAVGTLTVLMLHQIMTVCTYAASLWCLGTSSIRDQSCGGTRASILLNSFTLQNKLALQRGRKEKYVRFSI